MTHPDFTRFALHDYWVSLTEHGGNPRKQDFDPISIPHLLKNLSLVVCSDRLEDFRISVWGSALVELFGQERTGKTFGELTIIENWGDTFRDYLIIREEGQPRLLAGRTVSSIREHIEYERLSLPLWGDNTDGENLSVTHVISQFRVVRRRHQKLT